jgi:hypothetical protein
MNLVPSLAHRKTAVRRDFAVFEFGSNHDVNEIWLQILSNKPQVIHRSEICARSAEQQRLRGGHAQRMYYPAHRGRSRS